MFYQSPFASPSAAPAVPPAFNEVTQALRQVTAGNSFLYMVETKKLCLAVCGAEEVASALKSRNQAFDPKKIFHQELQNQILSFALLRVLPEAVVKTCIQAANAAAQADSDSAVSGSARLARELEAAAGESEDTVKAVQESLVEQPLFRMASQMPEVFANLEVQYEACSPYAAQLMKTLKSSMGLLVSAAANAAASLPAGAEGASADEAAAPAVSEEAPPEAPAVDASATGDATEPAS